jgi:hypothetical protein
LSNTLAGPLPDLPPSLSTTYCDGIAAALASQAGETYTPATTIAAFQAPGSAAAIATLIEADINAGSSSAQIAARTGYYWFMLDYMQRQSSQPWMAFRRQQI